MNTIVAKIDVTKIQKDRLFPGKNGAKYLDIVLLGKDEPDQYGNDFMIVQGVTKEELEAGVKGPILGNAKILGGKRQDERPNTTKRPAKSSPMHMDSEGDDDVPF